ncbi:MAG TPA: response regulator [Actinomycetota bacterium]|nr:response regulator [Actinomycetota bacterium]
MEVTGQEARFRAMFAEEAEGRLATLSELLLELERNGDDQELLSSVFREAHTLKGAAAVVGLADVLRVAHAMEEVLEGLRRGHRTATPATVDALLGAVDGMRELVPAVLTGHDRAAQADHLVATLHDPPSEAPPPDPEPPGPEALAAPEPAVAPEPTPDPAPPAQLPAQPPARRERRETVRLRVERLDDLVRLVGEASAAALRVGRLVTDQLGVEPAGIPELHELSRILEGLQERTLQARMVPFGTIAEPLRRAARDLARSLGKAVELELRGQETELDRGVLEQVADPLLHLVRNAIDHGIEPPEARLAAGTPRYGTVKVHATQLGSEVVVTVADDGRGIDLARVRQRAGEAGDALDGVGDDETIYAIFRSGLSTAPAVSEVSGRGVGLDVVRASLVSVRGRVEVDSEPGSGSEFRLSVPITLAVLPCLLVEAAGRRFGIPMHSVVSAEAAGWSEDHVEGQVVIRVRDTILPVSDLAATLGVSPGQGEAPASDSPAVVLASMTRRHAFRVGALLGQRNLVVKDLGRLLPRLALLAGASLEPDGSILLVLDVSGLVDRARWARSAAGPGRSGDGSGPSGGAGHAVGDNGLGAAHGGGDPPRPPGSAAGASVLVVDDTAVVRELERSILEGAGYRVRTAADGRLALVALADTPADLVVTDVEMPNCDGLELTRAIRAKPGLAGLPVVVVTSRSSEADRRLAMEAGADAYLVKGDLDQRTLLEVVGRRLGLAVPPAGRAGR